MRSQPRRLWLVVPLIALGVVAAINPIGPASAAPEKHQSGWQSDLPPACNGNPITASEFRLFSKKVWDRDLWEREKLNPKTLDAKAHKIHCAAGSGHLASMKRQWDKDAKSFYKHQDEMLFINRWTPEYGCTKFGICKFWAIPAYIVSCESGGKYGVVNSSSGARGAYQMIPSTYAQYCSSCDWSERDQDIAARRLYEAEGSGPWSCS
jgi:hypothetical protein